MYFEIFGVCVVSALCRAADVVGFGNSCRARCLRICDSRYECSSGAGEKSLGSRVWYRSGVNPNMRFEV